MRSAHHTTPALVPRADTALALVQTAETSTLGALRTSRSRADWTPADQIGLTRRKWLTGVVRVPETLNLSPQRGLDQPCQRQPRRRPGQRDGRVARLFDEVEREMKRCPDSRCSLWRGGRAALVGG